MQITAAELVQLARLQQVMYGGQLPSGWVTLAKKKGVFSPTDGCAFANAQLKWIVFAFKGVEIFDIRDVVGVSFKRVFGYSEKNAKWVEEFMTSSGSRWRYTVIGHSGGGGLASYVAGALGISSVCFNPGRVSPTRFNGNRHSFANSGVHQTIVRVKGDFWSDPIANPKLGPELPGKVIILESNVRILRRHLMTEVIVCLFKQWE